MVAANVRDHGNPKEGLRTDAIRDIIWESFRLPAPRSIVRVMMGRMKFLIVKVRLKRAIESAEN